MKTLHDQWQSYHEHCDEMAVRCQQAEEKATIRKEFNIGDFKIITEEKTKYAYNNGGIFPRFIECHVSLVFDGRIIKQKHECGDINFIKEVKTNANKIFKEFKTFAIENRE